MTSQTKSKWIVMGITCGALTLIATPFLSVAEGATSKTFYSASFNWKDNWKDGSEGGGNTVNLLRIVIAKTKKPRFNQPKVVARIMRGNHVEAVCGIENVEGYTHASSQGNVQLASSVDMSCKGTALGALAAPATLYFPEKSDVANSESTGRNKPVLRFGTWLQGYQQAVLQTEFDESARLITEVRKNESKEITRPGAEHVKLARAQ